PGNVASEVSRVRGCGAGSVDVDSDSFRLLGVELKLPGYERAMRRERVALKGVEQAAAFAGLSGGRRGSRGFSRAGDGEGVRHIQAKRRGVTVRGKVGKRKPASREEEISAVFVYCRGAHARNGTVVLIGEQAGIGEGQSDVSAGGHGR